MKLYEMSDHEFETGGTVDNALKKAGYCDGARSVINDGRTNISKDGIRYGVIGQNTIAPEAMDDIFQIARDLSYEHAVEQIKQEISTIEKESDLEAILNEHFGEYRCSPKLWAEAILIDYTTNDGAIVAPVGDEIKEHVWNEIEQTFNDSYENGGEHDWLYERDGYKLTNCLQSDIFVLASPYFTYAQFCSPCVPGACNLNSPLVFADAERDMSDCPRAYCLGHDFFEDNKAPYPVYSVETGELVSA